jgi:hypothetical protein
VENSPCALSAGCGPGMYCTLEMTAAEIAAGKIAYKCKTRGKLGDTCKFASDRDVNACVDGAYCGKATGETGFTCQAALKTGDTCNSVAVNANPFACEASGVCAPVSGTVYSCQATGEQGAKCSFTVECKAGLFCDAAGSKTCVSRLASGGTCKPEAAYCGGPGTGAARCTYLASECALGLVCKMSTATECGTWLDCGTSNLQQCCVSATGTECRDSSGTTCTAPTGTCGS